ncbi:hypothetical protein L6R53_12965 [Myxococcota bacterium]|nr:hypothetical protein [Myxococcota bacterium]
MLVVVVPGGHAHGSAPDPVQGLVRRHRVERALTPAILAGGGRLVTRLGDTVLACFDQPQAALLAALDGRRALHETEAGDRALPHHHARMALGFGPTVVAGERELYGPEVERARMLGERGARDGEVLLTDAFATALRPVPPGVGLHAAAGARVELAGGPFHLAADHRG